MATISFIMVNVVSLEMVKSLQNSAFKLTNYILYFSLTLTFIQKAFWDHGGSKFGCWRALWLDLVQLFQGSQFYLYLTISVPFHKVSLSLPRRLCTNFGKARLKLGQIIKIFAKTTCCILFFTCFYVCYLLLLYICYHLLQNVENTKIFDSWILLSW